MTFQQRQGETVADLPLDQPLEGPGAVDGVVPPVRQPRLGRVRHHEGEAPVGQSSVEVPKLDVDDVTDVVLGEGPEVHDLVDPVEELRLEGLTQVALGGWRS